MKKILLFILIFALLAGVGFFFWQRMPSLLLVPTPAGVSTTPETSSATSTVKRIDPYPHDKDRDGLTDVEEAKLGTSDLDFDTDHDGLSDPSEVNHWHTNPTKADTDGDGFSDGYEVINGYNPLGSGRLK